ncbi:MAG: integrin alpha, partial [Rubricoccaceae bacterium]|nr:integrin alpha [Rubricoccaceae bacterium]
YFGWAVSGVGDVNDDGIPDLAVGTIHDDDGGLDQGAVYILFLDRDGTVKAQQKISETEGGFTGDLDPGDRFGAGVAGLGDLNGDGVEDVAVGADQDSDGGEWRGAVYILFLNADGTVASHQKISSTEGGLVDVPNNYDTFGASVANIGDLDGDGIRDILVGLPLRDGEQTEDSGGAWILFLNRDGTVKAQQQIYHNRIFSEFEGLDRFGWRLDSIGDQDADGIVEVAVSNPGRGAIHILYLNADGTVKREQEISYRSGGLPFNLEEEDSPFRGVVAGFSDLDKDGLNEVVAGVVGDDTASPRGAVYLLFLHGETAHTSNTPGE